MVSILGSEKSPGGGHGNPLQYSCLENLHGQRGLVGYSSWGCKELNTAEQLTLQVYVSSSTTSGGALSPVSPCHWYLEGP